MDKPDSAGSNRAPVKYEDLMFKGLFLFYRQREREAVEYLRSALESQPKDLRARYLLCLAAAMHSDEATIEQMAKSAREIDAQNAYALACEGVRFMEYCNYPRADQYFEQALLKIPNDVDLWYGRGLLYDYSGDREKAIGAYLRVTKLDGLNVSGRLGLGNAYADVGEFDSAFEQYVKARELAPDIENPHSRIGRDLMFAGMAVEAIQELQQAVDDEPDEMAPYFHLLNAYRHLDKTDEALEIYSEIRRRFSDDPEETAAFFHQFGMWPEAIREYQRAIALSPNSAELHNWLATAFREIADWEAALSEYQRMIAIEADSRAGYAGMGEVLFRLGRYEEAVVALRKAVELDAKDFTALATLSDALVMLGKTQLASEVLEKQERIQKQAWSNYQAKYFGLPE